MDTKGFVVPPGQGRMWEMAAGRSSALKLLGGETGDSVMMFEETAPSGTQTTYHLHHDSDEVAYACRRDHLQDRRGGHGRRSGHLRLHAARARSRLEELGRRDGASAVPLHPGGRGWVFRGVAAAAALL